MSRFLPALLFSTLLGVSATAAAGEPLATLTLGGAGHVSAPPDMAILTTGVVTTAESARVALDENTVAMTELLALMKAAGVAPRDIQTAGFSIKPRQVYPKSSSGKAPYIAGYTVRNQVTVRIRDLAGLGDILDRAVTAGSNRIGEIRFMRADDTALYDRARKAAIADALHKAQVIAKAANVKLGRIVEISEDRTPPALPLAAPMPLRAARSAPVPVSAGELTFRVDIRVKWEIGH